MYRDRAFRKYQYFLSPDWQGGKYFSPGLAGSRSGGLLAATWASMVSLGREGYLRYAKAIFETAFAMQKAVCSHPELRLMGKPTWCFSFTSDVFDIYHVNDFMKARGWRFNGQQYPNAIHMCVTRPQTQPGVVDTFTRDLDEAVRYALQPAARHARHRRGLRRRPEGRAGDPEDDQRLHGRLPRRLAGRPARPRLRHERREGAGNTAGAEVHRRPLTPLRKGLLASACGS